MKLFRIVLITKDNITTYRVDGRFLFIWWKINEYLTLEDASIKIEELANKYKPKVKEKVIFVKSI